MTGIRDWGLGIGSQRPATAVAGDRLAAASTRRGNVDQQREFTQRRQVRKGNNHFLLLLPWRLGVSPVCHSVLHGGQARRLNARRGFSLLEVLVSMGILLLGALGVAALIPIGKLAMIETNKLDRTGTCGRAGIRDVKTRRMLDVSNWSNKTPSNVFVLDPLGSANGLNGTNFGGTASSLQRVSLNNVTAEDVFRCQDELIFDNPAGSSLRPRPVVKDSKGNVGPYPSISPPEPKLVDPVTQQYDGHFSWFVTVAASPAEVQAGVPWNLRHQFTVSVVVCWNRLFSASSTDINAGEVLLTHAGHGLVTDADDGYGGIEFSSTPRGARQCPRKTSGCSCSPRMQARSIRRPGIALSRLERTEPRPANARRVRLALCRQQHRRHASEPCHCQGRHWRLHHHRATR